MIGINQSINFKSVWDLAQIHQTMYKFSPISRVRLLQSTTLGEATPTLVASISGAALPVTLPPHTFSVNRLTAGGGETSPGAANAWGRILGGLCGIIVITIIIRCGNHVAIWLAKHCNIATINQEIRNSVWRVASQE